MARRKPCSIVNLRVAVSRSSGVNIASWLRPSAFAREKRRVGGAQQVLGPAAVIGIQTRSDAGPDDDFLAVYHERPVEDFDEPASRFGQHALRGGVFIHHGEFVSPQTSCEPETLRGLFQALCNTRQHLIAERVAQNCRLDS